MKKLIALLILFFAPLINQPKALAGPDRTTDFFMTEPSTLFDIGMVTLNMNMDILEKGKRWSEDWGFVGAEYIWDEDEIKISTYNFEASEIPTNQLRERCKKVITTIKYFCGVNSKTGLPFSEHSRCSSFFKHRGFSNKRVDGF